MNERKSGSGASGRNRPTRFRHWFRIETVSLAELGIQTFAVVFGILLALAIDSWHQSLQQRHTTSLALQSILDETTVNLKMLQQRAGHLEGMVAAMEKASDSGNAMDKQPCYYWQGWSGLQYPQVIDAAYKTAISTQALAHMPYKEAENIAEVYSSLELTQKVYDIDGNLVLTGVAKSLSFCRGIVHEIANNDRRIAGDLTAFMRQYGRMVPAPGALTPAGQ